jgi:ATPase subunit of ABC transporter with duplicated ATPase domains
MVENYEKQYKAQQKEIKTLEAYIQKNKVKTSTAKQAKSREKMLSRIDVMDAPKSGDIRLNLYFNYAPIASHKFLEVKNLEIGYTSSLLPPISFSIKSGTKLAITGFNGIGKSTLLKTLIGELKPICGEYKFVDDVKISYFEQEHHFDNPNITPLEEIHNLYPKLEHKEIRSLLARCGLRGDLAMQPIKTLSGGEQSKLKLCKVMMVKSNVLVLDEPTNHLDANARMDLLDALKKYQGTIIFVSHEKEFIDKLATEIYSFEDLLLS